MADMSLSSKNYNAFGMPSADFVTPRLRARRPYNSGVESDISAIKVQCSKPLPIGAQNT